MARPVGAQHQFQTPFSNRVTAKVLKGRHIVVECNVESLIWVVTKFLIFIWGFHYRLVRFLGGWPSVESLQRIGTSGKHVGGKPAHIAGELILQQEQGIAVVRDIAPLGFIEDVVGHGQADELTQDRDLKLAASAL